ncbi:hypothetical protein PH505_bb00310 [Pseudoalteromonas distincta]|uniref:hypothetical protein n=1 Tax=Pseudoalteromonas distincta TaxID=77608 RepID=UPI00020A0BC4|nr:hypothetical protein [Pseudoalteromonas distincta]EGI72883.1 hypothetical protein PH505_bb00310 [Pseudoalteromonas distincta]|tara:strand:+ start:8636 stop:8863 length:228 start_codon:yes stop_codon:yes gene_type:complete
MSKFDKLNNVGKGAALSEQASEPSTKPATKPKHINNLPVKAEQRFNALKAAGKVSGNLSAYMVQALLEKLEQDER